jgi:hypothetical protein
MNKPTHDEIVKMLWDIAKHVPTEPDQPDRPVRRPMFRDIVIALKFTFNSMIRDILADEYLISAIYDSCGDGNNASFDYYHLAKLICNRRYQ